MTSRNEQIIKIFEELSADNTYNQQASQTQIPARQRDARSYEMKKMLQKTFPGSKFTVKIHKFSMGEAIYIKTDLIKPWTAEDSDNQWKRGLPDLKAITPGMQATKQKQEYNKEMERKIEDLLQKFWHIDYDQASGEILGGGNTYINVGALPEPTTPIQEDAEHDDMIVKMAQHFIKAMQFNTDDEKVSFLLSKKISPELIKKIISKEK